MRAESIVELSDVFVLIDGSKVPVIDRASVALIEAIHHSVPGASAPRASARRSLIKNDLGTSEIFFMFWPMKKV